MVIKSMKRQLILGFIITVALFSLGFLISKIKGYNLNNVLFIEGILTFMIGVFSAIEGNSMGLSLQGLGSSNAQYNSRATLEVNKMEKEKVKGIKTNITLGSLTIYLGISGVIMIIISRLI